MADEFDHDPHGEEVMMEGAAVGEASGGGEGDGAGAGHSVASSLYPAPPRQAVRYTRENVARYRALRRAKEDDATSRAAAAAAAAAAATSVAATATSSSSKSGRKGRTTSTTDTGSAAFDWAHASPEERLARQRSVLEEAAHDGMEGSEGENASMALDEKETAGPKERAKTTSEDVPPAKLLPVPSWDILLEMEPPNVDWIEEDGYYTCFGEQWPIIETLPSLQDMSMRQVYSSSGDGEAIDRPAVLTTLLRTMLKSYMSLIDVVLSPPHEYAAEDGNWRFVTQDRAREINDVAINFTHLLNETRPLQAREQLRDMMRAQLSRRQSEAGLIRAQCAAMRAEVQTIRQRLLGEAEGAAACASATIARNGA